MIDQIVVGIYLIVTLIIGILAGRDTNTVSDFAVGKRNFSSIVLLSTIFASVVDGNGTLGLAEAVFTQGPFYCLAFLGIIFSYLSLAFFIAPRFDRFLGLLSSGDILGKLYGPKAKVFMGFAALFESVMLTGVQILAMTHIIQYFFAVPASIAAIFSSCVILCYSLRGGIRAVTATDVFQFGILIVAIPVICGIAIVKIGGFDSLLSSVAEAHEKTRLQIEPVKYLAIFASFALPALFPLTIQRMLMAKNTKQITTTFLVTGILSLPFYLVIACIAITGWVLLPNIDPNFIFPGLINEILPVGIKGFVIAGLLAVFMSSIDSSLNVAAVAVTHDLVLPLVKFEVAEKTKLRMAKFSSIVVSLAGVVIALYFNNIINIMFFCLSISNSAFFPGYLVGLLGFKPSRRGFWTGLIAASLTVFILTRVFSIFELYAGLIAIVLNLIILLSSHQKGEQSVPTARDPLRPRLAFSSPLANPVASNAFSIAIVVHAIGAFFVQVTFARLDQELFYLIYLLSAVLAFLLMFRELWWRSAQIFFKPLLAITLALSFPCISVFMCLLSGFSKVWLIDTIISFSILVLITEKRSILLISLSGVLAAISLYFFVDGGSLDLEALGNWSIISHIVGMTVMLILFRRQDAEKYQFLSSKLAHEASRSLSSLMLSADFLHSRLPDLIRSYEWAHLNGYNCNSINSESIDELKNLPHRLQNMGQRTAKTLDALLDSMYPVQNDMTKNFDVDIFACVSDAVADPSISSEQRGKIRVKSDHTFFISGDQAQIAQAILNLLENAQHAIAAKNSAFIDIWAENRSLFIKDGGAGIAKRDLPKIFDEFFSTKKTRGQGLAFCKQVITNNKGTITCQSEEGKFTQFELAFPRNAK